MRCRCYRKQLTLPSMQHAMNIRSATPADLDVIADILNQAIEERLTAHSEPVAAGQLLTWLAEHNADGLPVVVAEQASQVAGWASLSAYRRGRKAVRITAEISFYVERSHRGRGTGSALIRQLEQRAGTLGIRNLFGIIMDDNAPSIAIMRKHGYEQWGHMPGIAVFDSETKGHIYMGKHL